MFWFRTEKYLRDLCVTWKILARESANILSPELKRFKKR